MESQLRLSRVSPSDQNQTRTGEWSGGAMVLGKLPVPGRPTILITVGQGPTALAVGAGGVCLDIFTLIYPFSPLSPLLWETARYRLKYCLKEPLNPKQPTNQPTKPERLAQPAEIISIFHGCMVWIEKSVMSATDRLHEACRVMPNSNPE